MKKLKILLFISILFSLLIGKKPKNIILFIGDGAGFNHVRATNYYQYGKEKQQPYQDFSVSCAMSTYSVNGSYNPKQAWQNFGNLLDKYTDSAASGTAIATGTKTYNGAIGVDNDKNEVKNIIEYAENRAMSTGVISSVQFSHATPASFVAHNTDRGNYEEISREMIKNSKLEVLMGAGHPFYNDDGEKINNESGIFPNGDISYNYVGGKETWQDLTQNKIGNDSDHDGKEENWKLIQKKKEFSSLKNGDTPERVIGIPRVRHTLQYNRENRSKEPFQTAFNDNIPRLNEMTSAGLNVLDDNDKGFFLMVESGAVDWASHDNNSSRMIEEEIALNKSVKKAIEWVNDNSSWDETLIIVTADHETGYLHGPGSGGRRKENQSSSAIWKPLKNNGKNEMPEMEWYSGGHSNSLVPFYAQGPGSKELVDYANQEDSKFGKYLDNAELGQTLINLVKQK